MKKIFFLAFLFLAACKTSQTNHIVEPTEKVGCWYESAVGRAVCGRMEAFSKKDSTYTMRTFDGWAMKVKACDIQW